MTLEFHVDRAKVAAERLFHAFQGDGNGIFGTRAMPEDVLPREVVPGSEDHLRFLTFTVSIDYQRPAAQLWEASRHAFECTESRRLFDPSEVRGMPFEELKESLRRLSISRKHGPDTQTWAAVATVLERHFEGSVSRLVEACHSNATAILSKIREGPTRIRFLAGEKIGPLWLRMLYDNAGLALAGMNELPLPVDVHVARSSLAIGAVAASGSIDETDLRAAVQQVWADACRDRPYYPLRLDEALWQQSRLGCTNRTSSGCPKRADCCVADLCVAGRISLGENVVKVATSPLRPMFAP